MADFRTYPFRARCACVAALLVAAVAMAGCSDKKDRVYFNGQYFPAKAKAADKDDRQNFNVSVRRVDAGLAGAREAARHAGQQYCLKNFGTSEIKWVVDPASPQAASLGSSNSLSASGRCLLW